MCVRDNDTFVSFGRYMVNYLCIYSNFKNALNIFTSLSRVLILCHSRRDTLIESYVLRDNRVNEDFDVVRASKQLVNTSEYRVMDSLNTLSLHGVRTALPCHDVL